MKMATFWDTRPWILAVVQKAAVLLTVVLFFSFTRRRTLLFFLKFLAALLPEISNSSEFIGRSGTHIEQNITAHALLKYNVSKQATSPPFSTVLTDF
jgi:hypothetical protein